MTKPARVSGYLNILPDMVLIYILVAVWELFSAPSVRPSPSGAQSGVLISLLILALGAARLGKHPGYSSRFFIYGFVGSLLFVPRFLSSESLYYTVNYQGAGVTEIVIEYVVFSFFVGTICWIASTWRSWVSQA